MSERRPSVPMSLKRLLFEESGYRCAIPTCRGTSALEMAHIEPWSQVREHAFENMIVLCAVDHVRFDRGDIPKQSVQVFKANLGLIQHRYNDQERRLLEVFTQVPAEQLEIAHVQIPSDLDWTIYYLLKDDVVELRQPGGARITINGVPSSYAVHLTAKGRNLVERLRSADPLT